MKYYSGQEFRDIKISDQVLENIGFEDCDFIDCYIEDLEIYNLHLLDCRFMRTSIINPLARNGNHIENISFKSCFLMGVNWAEFVLGVGLLPPINRMESTSINYSTFYDMNFRKFDFSNLEIINSIYNKCELSESDFSNTRLDGSEFVDSNLSKADFREALGYEVDILTCKMKGAKFSGAEYSRLLNVLDLKIY